VTRSASREPLDMRVSSVDVERRGRFRYVVVTRVPNGIDMEFQPACMFKWTAMRLARKTWAQERQRQQRDTSTVAALAVDI